MLRFTAAGVVAAPRTLQLRVGGELRGSVPAGVVPCDRELTDQEITDNLRYFTLGQRGPRGTPCEALVLSGVPPQRLAAVVGRAQEARDWGIRRVVLHAAADDLAWVDEGIDEVVVPAGPIGPCVRPIAALVVLEEGADVLAQVQGLGRVHRLILTWPFPPAGRPMAVGEVARVLADIERLMKNVETPWIVKGIPACLLGAWRGRHVRTQNRWYADVLHQREKARLLLPDILRFTKLDSCRFCCLDPGCDGVPRTWLERFPSLPLRPVVDSGEDVCHLSEG